MTFGLRSRCSGISMVIVLAPKLTFVYRVKRVHCFYNAGSRDKNIIRAPCETRRNGTLFAKNVAKGMNILILVPTQRGFNLKMQVLNRR